MAIRLINGRQEFGCTSRSRCSRAWQCGRGNWSIPRPAKVWLHAPVTMLQSLAVWSREWVNAEAPSKTRMQSTKATREGTTSHNVQYRESYCGRRLGNLASLSAGAVSRSVSRSTKCNCPCALLPSVNKSAQSAPRRPPARPPARPTDDLSMCVCVSVFFVLTSGF